MAIQDETPAPKGVGSDTLPLSLPLSLPLIVQGDKTILLDVHSPGAKDARDALLPFAELVTSPEHIHTYRLTPLSLWNALSSGFTPEDAVTTLKKYSRYDVPSSVQSWIVDTGGRFGKLKLVSPPTGSTDGDKVLYLVSQDPVIYKQIQNSKSLSKLLSTVEYPLSGDGEGGLSADGVSITLEECQHCFRLNLTDRGTVKEGLLELGWPVDDLVPLVAGEPLEIGLRETTLAGLPLKLRDYQTRAQEAVVGDMGPGTGFGTVVLPCGAGKTIVGIAMMASLKTSTLIVTTNVTSVHQWIAEILDKTTLTRDDIAEYTGKTKCIRPVTVATYQILSWRPDKTSEYPHFALFKSRHWGLIIYDEVHTLPAPVFRVVAEIQAIRRVGLTATLVREDHQEGLVFSLVGPKRYDVPWKELEHTGYIAHAVCIEVRLDLPYDLALKSATATPKEAYRIAAENPTKVAVVKSLVEENYGEHILIIGQYLDQLQSIARALDCPIITGRVSNNKRDAIYNDFRSGKINTLVVSKVANFAVDLPDASVAIQVSGTFGSRQEEAQRLGRIMRPKEHTARFYTLVTRNTAEEDFAANRQKFLAEQGYEYQILTPTIPNEG